MSRARIVHVANSPGGEACLRQGARPVRRATPGAGRKTVEARYALDTMIERLTGVYDELLEGGR